MAASSVNTRRQAASPPKVPTAARQAVAKNNAGISEVTFFSTPERPEHSKVRHEPHTLEIVIIVAAILLGVAAYFWVEQSNVVKRLGEPAAVKQSHTVPSPQPLHHDVTSSAARAHLKTTESPEKIEPPEMGRPEPQPPVAVKQRSAVTPRSKTTPQKIPADTPATVEQQPQPSPSPVAEPAPAQPAPDNTVVHAAEADDNKASSPVVDDDLTQVTEPSIHHKATSKSHKLSLAQSRPPEEAVDKNEKTVESADPVKEFLRKWGESIKQGKTHPDCTQQARALNQCH